MITWNALDRFIGYMAPTTALRRCEHKLRLEVALQNVEKSRQAQQRKYEAAAKGRHYSDWHSPELSANQEVLQSIQILRNRSRDLARNDVYAINAVRVLVNNVVGTGIIPTPKGPSESKIKIIKDLWTDWADKTTCDFDDMNSFYGLQHLIAKTVLESGECIVRRARGTSQDAIPLRLQVLEGDFIDSSKHNGAWQTDNTITYYGIKLNRQGRRLGYWIYKGHPSEFGGESEFIEADDIIHLYVVERPGQIRGIPLSAGAMLRIKDLGDYEFTERARNKVAAAFAVFITDDVGAGDGNPDEGTRPERIEPGTIEYLSPGKKVEVAQPPSNTGYAEYVKSNLRGISAGFGATYESVTNDYGNVNFSSGRMGWLEMFRNVEQLQWNLMIVRFCDKAYPWFIEAIQVKGYIPFKVTPKVTWTPPRREMIDPLKEITATKEAIRAGLTTWQNEVRKNGYIPEELMAEFKKDKEMWDALQLMPSSDPRFDSNRPSEELGDDPNLDDEDNPQTGKKKK